MTHVHLNDLPDNIELHGDLAIDTETLGLKNDRDRLCVVQIADAKGKIHLVQFDGKSYDAPNLVAILKDPSRVKIFHFARFDIAVINHYLGVLIENVFCTKIASKFARTYTDSHGLKSLCAELLSVMISKQQQSSDWGKAHLSKQQVEYAASDVRHLHEIKELLEEMLIREGRFEMADACFKFLPQLAKIDAAGWGDVDIFAH